MNKLKAEGYCGKQHTLDELEACGDCKKYRQKMTTKGQYGKLNTEPKEYKQKLVFIEREGKPTLMLGEFGKEVWNEAIEAAAEKVRETHKAQDTDYARKLWHEIRGLKK